MFSDDQLIPISALQHFIFCPRQAALIHLEQAWAENQFTAEGRILHEHAHSGCQETRPDIRITRSLNVVSLELGLVGQCDIVEFHHDGSVIPVEYKRGKPKILRADEIQICAQAICLEEMLKIRISYGYLFYGKRKRRTKVDFNDDLRKLTEFNLIELRALFERRCTPKANYHPEKCDACSLIDECQPFVFRMKQGVNRWFENQLYDPSES